MGLRVALASLILESFAAGANLKALTQLGLVGFALLLIALLRPRHGAHAAAFAAAEAVHNEQPIELAHLPRPEYLARIESPGQARQYQFQQALTNRHGRSGTPADLRAAFAPRRRRPHLPLAAGSFGLFAVAGGFGGGLGPSSLALAVAAEAAGNQDAVQVPVHASGLAPLIERMQDIAAQIDPMAVFVWAQTQLTEAIAGDQGAMIALGAAAAGVVFTLSFFYMLLMGLSEGRTRSRRDLFGT